MNALVCCIELGLIILVIKYGCKGNNKLCTGFEGTMRIF